MEQGSRRRLLLALAALGYLLGVGCSSPGPVRPVLVGFGPTVLPDLGLSASAAVQVEEHRWATTWFEAQLTRQFLDDSDLADDGNPPAGDWTQFRAGLLFTIPSTERRSWTARTGSPAAGH